jgi:protein-tyrosine-phosphatase
LAGLGQILFVCTGNTCRSPLAAALGRRILAATGVDATVASAGIGAIDDAPASGMARAVAREAGLDLESHRARLLTRGDVLGSDLVLTMGPRQREFIRVLAPEAMDRVFVVGDYAAAGESGREIRDPFGGDREAYRRTLRELGPIVEQALRRFEAEAGGRGSEGGHA